MRDTKFRAPSSLLSHSSFFWLVCLVCGASTFLLGQQAGTPTVTFTLDFPGSEPSHYGVSVSFNGRTSYISDGKLTQDSDPGVPFTVDLDISGTTVARIFALAKEADYFEKNVDLKKKKMAFTGDKTLTYVDERRNTTANYGYSSVPAVQELTTLFQRLSATIEFGRRLEYQYRYQKLALDEELKHMEDASTQGGLVELAAAAPILQKIIQDPSVMNTVRARAQRLLEHASAPK
jgi:hypothetical protein